jgi:LPXTG-motif cell wall-anchored protein
MEGRQMNLATTITRSTAATAVALLVAAGGAGPALADPGHGHKGGAAHGQSTSAPQRSGTPSHANKSKANNSKAQKSKAPNSNADSADRSDAGRARAGKASAGNSRNSHGKANPPRHTPVTVCHRLGNGGYHLLTFDDSALKAHVGHGDLYPVPAAGCPAGGDTGSSTPGDHGATPPKHTPVTVCHLLGNGGYHLLTFDDSALKAHVGHGDLYPVPAGGCPTTEIPATGAPGTTTPGTTTPGTTTPGTTTPEVLGVEAFAPARARSGHRSAAVLGTEAYAGRAGATGPSDGILPQTGAEPIALALVTGLGLLAAGGAVLARRRTAACG